MAAQIPGRPPMAPTAGMKRVAAKKVVMNSEVRRDQAASGRGKASNARIGLKALADPGYMWKAGRADMDKARGGQINQLMKGEVNTSIPKAPNKYLYQEQVSGKKLGEAITDNARSGNKSGRMEEIGYANGANNSMESNGSQPLFQRFRSFSGTEMAREKTAASRAKKK